MRNRIELKTFEHVSVIEQTFDFQILSFVMKVVKENMDYLVQFQSIGMFISLNPQSLTYSRKLLEEIYIPRTIACRYRFFSMIKKYLLDNYDQHLFRVMIFYKCVKEILLKQQKKKHSVEIIQKREKINTWKIIQNCRQFGSCSVAKSAGIELFSHVWLSLERITKEDDENKKLILLLDSIDSSVQQETIQFISTWMD